MADQKEPLFPALPEDLAALSDDEVQKLLDDSISAAALIEKDDEEFLAGLTAEEVIAELAAGVEQIKALRVENKARVDAYEEYKAEKARQLAELAEPVAEAEDDSKDETEAEGDEAEVVAETEPVAEADEVVEETVEEQVPVTASAPPPRFSRTPPAPAKERIVVDEKQVGNALVAAGGYRENFAGPLDPLSLAKLQITAAVEHGPAQHNGQTTVVEGPHGNAVFDGPRVKTARVDFEFPGDRELTGDAENDIGKIRAAMPPTVRIMGQPGEMEPAALTASGGICAPSTPFYGQVNFATEAEPVWDSLPVFRAARGGVNVSESTYIADITSAISSISEADDALGGTFATKSCQDLSCPEFTETFVQILAHCREYGNLNARTWPEKIAHENALTMAALARTTEDFMLERIKALSVNVTNGVETLGALIYLVDAIVKAKFGIAGRFRMPANARFRALLPAYTLDLLLLDTIQTQFDRFKSRGEIDAYLRSAGIDPIYYIDGNFAAGDDQLPDATQAAGALDGLPNTVQWAIYPDGAFLGIDAGSLELGIVRDSTLNSTNDFQVFGERFRNLVRLAPAQSAYWVTTDWCPSGQFPPAGTVRTCE